jgi:hypothetical protein
MAAAAAKVARMVVAPLVVPAVGQEAADKESASDGAALLQPVGQRAAGVSTCRSAIVRVRSRPTSAPAGSNVAAYREAKAKDAARSG